MTYSLESSTPAHYAELLAAALNTDDSRNWEPSPSVIGDVAFSETRTIGATIATQTVTLYPEFVRGRAKGSVSSTITWTDSDNKFETKTGTVWFWFNENCDVLGLRIEIAHAFQALK
jgi:hypothetical protein